VPRFDANISLLYVERPFLDRFAAAARDGFEAVEMLSPYEYPPPELRARLEANGLACVLINTPAGDRERGDRGFASIPARRDDFRRGVAQALEYSAALGNKCLHVMAGLIGAGDDRARHRACYIENLAYAAREASSAGITALIEPINPRTIPGYFLNRQDEAHAICAEVGAPNLRVQMDLFHCQIVEGDVAMKIRKYAAHVAHMQIAGVPERHEPDTGEVNYPYLFDVIDEAGYKGWIGCEYHPKAGTSEGLGWARRYLRASGS
jgi:hydroxypyruvate isomerase